MDVSVVALSVLILLSFAILWFGVYYYSSRPLEAADATARVTGNCGDTMEIALRFAGDKVQQARHFSDGCSISNQCVEAAAMLAEGKSVEELQAINMITIMDVVGRLPDTHLHCVQLAETTLQQVVIGYLQDKDMVQVVAK